MFLSVFCYSLVPLLLITLSGVDYPFIFNAVYRFGAVCGALLFLLCFYRDMLLDGLIVRLVWSRMRKMTILLVILPYFSYTAFAWSAAFVDVSLTTVILEFWPVLYIVLTGRMFREEHRFRPLSLSQILLVILGFTGFVFVVLSQSDGAGWFGAFSWRHMLGVGLAVLASLIASSSSYNVRWAVDLRTSLALESSMSPSSGPATYRLELFCLMAAFVIGSAVSSLVNLIVGLSVGEVGSGFGMSLSHVLAIGIVGGALLDSFGTVFQRTAVLRTNNLGVNAIAYSTPVLALAWLWSFRGVGVDQPGYLIIGAAAIIVANLLINFEAEVRWGFKALLIAIWTCGAVTYLREGFFGAAGVTQWNWSSAGYFESITLAATVFTLLLAFRVTRLVSRTSEEDNRTFVVYRNLDLLVKRGVIDGEVCRHMMELDRSRDLSAVRESYISVRGYMDSVAPEALGEVDGQLLSEAGSSLDSLVRSKQVDIHLGEIFALVIFASVTVGLALFSRPPEEAGWPRLLSDVFAFVVSSVIIFLLVHIFDLQRERAAPKLVSHGSIDGGRTDRRFLVLFPDTARRSFDQWLSMVVGFAMTTVYLCLLAQRWLGWFS